MRRTRVRSITKDLEEIMSRATPSKQVDAAFNMGGIEARVAFGDTGISAWDYNRYIRNAEIAEMMADNKVLKAIENSGFLISDSKLKKRYDAYKNKYWKQSK